jgi:uncharacterized protein
MKPIVPLAVFSFFGIAIAMAFAQPNKRNGDAPMIQAVIHVNFEDAERQGHGLKNLANILKESPDAKLITVCHGGGIKLLVQGETQHAKQISELMDKGVQFVACENTLKDKNIALEKLLSGVSTVASGAVEVIQRQHAGFSYFKP